MWGRRAFFVEGNKTVPTMEDRTMLEWLEFTPLALWVKESWGWPFALTPRAATIFVSVSSLVFVFAAFQLNRTCGMLSPVALAIVFWYSLAKRFTSYTQLFLGLAMAVAKSLRASWGIILLCGAFAHPISWIVLGETATTFRWFTLGAMAIVGLSLEAYALLREPQPIELDS
jgi:hypothetical protein